MPPSNAGANPFDPVGFEEDSAPSPSPAEEQTPAFDLPVDATATPMSYTIGDRQYVLVNAGGHAMYARGTGDHLIAFSLPVEPRRDPPRRIPWRMSDASRAVAKHEILPDGRIHLSIRHAPLAGVTPAMLAWWYRVLPLGQVEFDGALRPLYHTERSAAPRNGWLR